MIPSRRLAPVLPLPIAAPAVEAASRRGERALGRLARAGEALVALPFLLLALPAALLAVALGRLLPARSPGPRT